ncbi:MAG: hypothetical protein HGB12_04905 [Bacteroidetes bacterium]|nr:hypothetical protein [Bacteroidota bacterium]
MDIYSPKSKNPENFKKNTIKGEIFRSEIVFELNDKQRNINIDNNKVSMFDTLKVKFYDRMALFFDYEQKVKDKSSSKINLVDEY